MKKDQSRKQQKRNLLPPIVTKEMDRKQIIEENRQDSKPIIEDLAKAGIMVDWISDLYTKRLSYKECIPLLLKWLPVVENFDVKEEIVRALSIPWARSIAAPVLIHELRNIQKSKAISLQWAIGNALAVVADKTVVSELIDITLDPGYGKSREMLVIALGNINEPRVEKVLIDFLADNDLAGYAIMSLGKIKSKKAYALIKSFLTHPKAWIRSEAQKAISKIEKDSQID